MDNTAHKTEAKLRDLSTKVDLSNTSIVNLRNVADQVMSFVKTFPQEIRDRLQAITQANWRTYQAILQIQNDISRTPNALLESNIQFTNALGEYRSLPYEYFCQWEQPFEGFLRAQFKGKPAEEDTRLYGARPEPADDAVIDATSLSFEPPQKRNAPDLSTTLERSPKYCRVDDDNSSTQVLTAMDWNNGASPIAAWLNQSAMPSTTPTEYVPERSDESLSAQEGKEMQMFRKVHVKTAPCLATTDGHLVMDKDFARLRPGARIFYRNIKDKFAHIPSYLARRLADANLDRAEKLQKTKQARVQHEVEISDEERLLLQLGYETHGRWGDIAARIDATFIEDIME
ncbi:MAG: hypothetical protein Q9192_005104 [Flavoplaca navasiana]